ncbi:MAG TPA: GNAT family N-acetyltransferase [Gemmatimonadales bacterium]|nr:GNAT family N-acetyltransferase [Gemmatimonadales bacterium]
MPALVVRPATPSDLDRLVPLFDGYRRFYEQPSDPALARDFLGERLERMDTVLFVAELDDRAVGFTHLFPIFSSTRCRRLWLLNDLFVAPEGRGQGVARALLRVAEQYARSTGACGLELATAHTNTPAQRLYESLGWQLDRTFRHYELTFR